MEQSDATESPLIQSVVDVVSYVEALLDDIQKTPLPDSSNDPDIQHRIQTLVNNLDQQNKYLQDICYEVNRLTNKVQEQSQTIHNLQTENETLRSTTNVFPTRSIPSNEYRKANSTASPKLQAEPESQTTRTTTETSAKAHPEYGYYCGAKESKKVILKYSDDIDSITFLFAENQNQRVEWKNRRPVVLKKNTLNKYFHIRNLDDIHKTALYCDQTMYGGTGHIFLLYYKSEPTKLRAEVVKLYKVFQAKVFPATVLRYLETQKKGDLDGSALLNIPEIRRVDGQYKFTYANNSYSVNVE